MKTLLTWLMLTLSFSVFAQRYKVGLVKKGTAISNVEGTIIVQDSLFLFIIDGTETMMKITRRDGFTLHVTDGTTSSRFVITHASGKLHGFEYNRSVKHEREHHHDKIPVIIYYCAIEKN